MNKIKEARQQAGLTQKTMHEMLGIPKRTIEDWDMGRRYPPEWVERLLIEKLKSIQNNN
ncbi:helix-turn-helix domain-containing protein [Veillonella montpellierensis]|uniref:helix-turn-helix domain-containing protein n=1 Tax=Veillonella montpellierensis TaxID=187328 RepID=UPI0023F7D39E|nr:helix-turn-helix transcriptional regulator [Veillonella montpellierensis]